MKCFICKKELKYNTDESVMVLRYGTDGGVARVCSDHHVVTDAFIGFEKEEKIEKGANDGRSSKKKRKQ